jgi:hypothetical protein
MVEHQHAHQHVAEDYFQSRRSPIPQFQAIRAEQNGAANTIGISRI